MTISIEQITLENSRKIEKISGDVAGMSTDIELIKNDISLLKLSNEKINAQIDKIADCVKEQKILSDSIKKSNEKVKHLVMWGITNINNIIIFSALVYVILFSSDISLVDFLKK